MFDTLGLICMIWWCMMLFHPSDADIHCTGSQESPITNVKMKMNWRKMELSWESNKNFSDYTCTIMNRKIEHTPCKVNSPLCRFSVGQDMPVHEGLFFFIEVPNTNISKNCSFIPGGINGSAIENFSCVIYNISLMNCTWQAGRDAPGDTQYFLYWQNSRDDNETECELYIKDENGRNMGCRFKNVRIGSDESYFLVNGSSKDSPIQFYRNQIELFRIEKLMPPTNIIVICNEIEDDCTIQWQRPLISHSNKDMCFQYEVNINYKANAEGKPIYTSIQEGGNSHIFRRPNTKKKYLLKMRTAGTFCLVSPAWGEWSASVEFGNEEIISFSVWILLVVAVATLLVIIATVFFCKRTGCWKAAFSQIPEPKNALQEFCDTNVELMESKIQPKTSENEEILLVADIPK